MQYCIIVSNLTDASQTTVTVTVLSVLLSLVLTLSLATCTVSAVVHAVMYKRLQSCRAESKYINVKCQGEVANNVCIDMFTSEVP